MESPPRTSQAQGGTVAGSVQEWQAKEDDCMNNTKRLATIEFLLKDVPTFTCKEGCSDCCGVVPMTRLEWKRIQERTGIKTQFTSKGRCALLKNGKCSVYDIRPAICRIFGTSEYSILTCPHGCRSQQLLSKTTTDNLTDRVRTLGLGMVLDNKPLSCVF